MHRIATRPLIMPPNRRHAVLGKSGDMLGAVIRTAAGGPPL